MTVASKKYLRIAAMAYLALMIALVWGLFAQRQNVLRDLDSSEARGDWQAWRSDVERQQQEPQTVARRVPKSAEPPALVLMRDYFVTCLVGAVLFVSLLYWALAGLAIGAAAGGGG
ncbi:MAG: hypothetical protein WD851_10495, partial [Pirellulales bacterium]